MASFPEIDWKVNIGCPECGLISAYGGWHVHWGDAPYEGEGTFRSNTVCIAVEFQCVQNGCRATVRFYTTIPDRSEREFDALRLKLKKGFFIGECPRRHSILPVPLERIKLYEVFDEIPTDPTLTLTESVREGWSVMPESEG